MTPADHEHTAGCLLGLTAVAAELGVTRSAVNLMVHDGRLAATRVGPHWFVCRDTFEEFHANYRPAASAGRRLGRRDPGPDMPQRVHELLQDWGEACVDELSEVVARDPGNVRKYLAILKARGLAEKTGAHTWRPLRRNLVEVG